MESSEKLGFTKENFDVIYDACEKIKTDINKKENQETFEEFLKKGSKKLLYDKNMIDNIAKAVD